MLYIRTQRGLRAVARERVNCLSCRALGAGGTLPEHARAAVDDLCVLNGCCAGRTLAAAASCRRRWRSRCGAPAPATSCRCVLCMCLKAGTSVYFPTPLGGVQCSFEHKLPRRRGSRGQRESTEPEIGVAGREQARPRFPAFLAGSGRSSPNQRSSRQGMLAWNFRSRLRIHERLLISQGRAPSVVAWAKP